MGFRPWTRNNPFDEIDMSIARKWIRIARATSRTVEEDVLLIRYGRAVLLDFWSSGVRKLSHRPFG
jgi:hypothetical protein